MKAIASILIAVIVRNSHAGVDEFFPSAVAMVETGFENIGGDNGRAAGIAQLHRKFCEDVGADWSDAWNPAKALEITRKKAEENHAALVKLLKREPTSGELYACHRMGLKGFKDRGCQMLRCSKSTQHRSKCVENWIEYWHGLILTRKYNELAAEGDRLKKTRPSDGVARH